MKEDENLLKYFSFIFKKLRYLALVIMLLSLILVFSVNRLALHLPVYYPVFVLFIPLISFFIFFLINQIKSKFRNNMSHYKYSLYFPFYFYDDPAPKMSARIDMDKVRNEIRPCDIVLRRYNHYIDGLIFSENSYFTHVGIFCTDYEDIASQVLHAEADKGVHTDSLDKFCECDDLAVLRFSFKETEEEIDMLRIIEDERRPLIDIDKIKEREKAVFLNLKEKTKSVSNYSVKGEYGQYAEGYSDIILDRAISLLKTPYDLKFNFEEFENLSCIEFVWYCFKFLFPLHRIRAKDFEFFQLIKMPVIVPDVFVRNDFFELVYTSVPVKTKKELMTYAKADQKQFWKYICMVWLWDLIFLSILYCVFHTWLKPQ